MHIFTPQRDDDRSRPRPDGEAEEQEDVLRRPGQGLPQHLPEEDPLKGQLSVLITISRACCQPQFVLEWCARKGNSYFCALACSRAVSFLARGKKRHMKLDWPVSPVVTPFHFFSPLLHTCWSLLIQSSDLVTETVFCSLPRHTARSHHRRRMYIFRFVNQPMSLGSC